MIPMPPCRAIVTAIVDSVTVSMLALINGMFSLMFLDNRVDRSVCERLVISENLGTRRTSSNVNPSLILKRTSYQRKKFCYKPFLFFITNFLCIERTSFVALTLCVRKISAPLSTETNSAANEPYNRSCGSSFPVSFPINDLFETETKRGKPFLIKDKFCSMIISRSAQLDLILVNGNPVPDFLKKPIAGSTIILFLEMLIPVSYTHLTLPTKA